MDDVENSDIESSRLSLVAVIDGFVDKINQIRMTLLGISLSALILAPIAIGLSAYLITHPQFYFILDEFDEFGAYLSVFLGMIIIISLTWLALGMRQYIMLKSWNAKYSNYTKKRDEIDSKISSEFALDEDEKS
jgi:hypothetical protein